MPSNFVEDTIFALSSGTVPSGVAVIRISGPQCRFILETIAGSCPEPRLAALKSIRHRNGDLIDSGLVLFFKGPASFTGEDCAELQVHGGRAVVDAIHSCLLAFDGVRLAEAGEFSKRAFLNGKIDLVEVEGLADLISAETEMQRRLALEYASGTLSNLYDSWAERLTRGRAFIEAELDFADEDDVPDSVSSQVWADMEILKREIADHLDGSKAAEIIRDGFKIVIAGEPNAGKSSLMNKLVGREIAIVTEIEGTTRDIIQADLNIDGYLVRLFDTAGLRDTEDPVEKEGIARALKAVEMADLVLYLQDINQSGNRPSNIPAADLIYIGTKNDGGDRDARFDTTISAATGKGLDELREHILSQLSAKLELGSGLTAIRERHRYWLSGCEDHIDKALASDQVLDVRAEYLRIAADMIGRITGRTDAEDLLDVIFAQFCIGK